MKKNHFLPVLLLFFSFAFSFLACENEPEEVGPNGGTTNPDKTIADPEGTIILSMHDFDNGNIRIDDRIFINKENWTGDGCYFVSIGEMKGLGNIETIPTKGWAKQIGVYPNHGYVAYNGSTDTYYRLFVTEYLYNTSEEVVGAKVKYQKPFRGKDEAVNLDSQSLSFSSDGGTEKVFFKNTSIIPFSLTQNQSWCHIQRISNSDNLFPYDGISIIVDKSGLPTTSSDTITFETLYGKKTFLTIQRGGHAYLEASEDSLIFNAYGGSKLFKITTNMDWTATTSESWIEVSSSSGSGNATIQVSLGANPTSQKRSGIVKVASGNMSASIQISQIGGNFSVSTSSLFFSDTGETKSLMLSTPFTWTAAPSDSWIKLSTNSGSGDATLSITTTANNTTAERKGMVTFCSDKESISLSVTQAGGILSVSQSSLRFIDKGETKSLNIQASNQSLEWSVKSSESWVCASSTSGNGSTTISITAEANNSTSDRAGTIAILSGDTSILISIIQSGGTISVSNSSLNFKDSGDSKSISIITSNSTLEWTATASDSWFNLSSTSGRGNADISVSAATNNSTSDREGTIVITAGEKKLSVSVVQAGGNMSVYPTSINDVPESGGTYKIELTTSTSFSWTATVSDSWLNISPMSGNGSTTLALVISDNDEKNDRTGMVTFTSGSKSASFSIHQIGWLSIRTVNLGLPSGTLWAKCNIGATSAEEYGDYFAWGETSTKSQYTWESLKYYESGNSSLNIKLSKYNNSDGKSVLDLSDDVARTILGDKWCTPSKVEWEELIDNCTGTWITLNGVEGYAFKSKKNGESIFLPAAGCENSKGLNEFGQKGLYWSSNTINSSSESWALYFSSTGTGTNTYFRYFGFSVRPVIHP